MAKKKKKNEDPFVQAQKLANNSAVAIQKMADKTTMKTFEFNKEEAATARDWQKMMSDTAHQREVKDLQKAGLNPVLSANSGAQSYTTSSASAQATDASSSIAGLYGSAMSSAANRYSADKSAAAQLKASRQQAAAARYAAQQSAAAQKYAADRSAEVQKYKADKDYQIKKYQTDNQRPSTVVGMFDKILEKYKLYGKVSDSFKKGISAIDEVHKKENDFKVNKALKFTYDNANKAFKLGKIDPILQKLGQPSTEAKRKVIFNAFYKHQPLAMYQVGVWYAKSKKSKPVDRYKDNYHVNPY